MRRSELAPLAFGVTIFDEIFGSITFELFCLSMEMTFAYNFKIIYEFANIK